jgi:SAM-dependent methyltransferase
MLNMKKFYDTYLQNHVEKISQPVTVLDIGAMNVNGSYREIFSHSTFKYLGLDLQAGDGVDIISDSPYHYPLPENYADIVLSGQMLEHCEFFWQAFTEMLRVAKPGAFVVLIVPSKGHIHRYPVDCYRFLPDAMPALARHGRCHLLSSWHDEDSEWGDITAVFMKPALKTNISATAPDDFIHEHCGKHYIEFLSERLANRASQAHLEIGTRDGASIAPLNCSTLAVDPNFNLAGNIIGRKKCSFFFQMTSDDFFKDYDPEYLLKAKLDTAFLDGMHHFEYTLRDFLNTERFCSTNSVIYLHDCLPVTVNMASRDVNDVAITGKFAHWWAGDVWKLLPTLKKYRPELSIKCYDCPPTGIVEIAGLDPSNTVLIENYDTIIDEFSSIELTPAALKLFLTECNICSSAT